MATQPGSVLFGDFSSFTLDYGFLLGMLEGTQRDSDDFGYTAGFEDGLNADTPAPVVTIISLPELNTNPVVLQIYDESGLSLRQLTCQDHSEAPRYVVYDAENGFYHPFGGRSTVSGLGTQVNPYVFTIYRRGRWPTDISLDFRAVCVDSSGNYVNVPATFDTEEAPIV